MEQGITVNDAVNRIATGEIIKQYEDDKPFPGCLIPGTMVNNKCIHVAVSYDGKYIHLITAYYPAAGQGEPDFKTRKQQPSGETWNT